MDKSKTVKNDDNALKTWECTACEMEEEEFFQAPLKKNGYLPDCPKCGNDYRVFEVKS